MFHRRELLQVGCSSLLGLGLSGVLQNQIQAAAHNRRAKSVVLMFMSGGGSHIDTFDPKPESSEIKGEFGTIATGLPGIHFSDKMAGLATRTDKFAIVRSMSHKDNRHLSGSHNALTGAMQIFRGDSNQAKSLNRADWPSYGSAMSHLRPRIDGLPSQVTLPHPLIEGVLVWPGQHAGFIGAKHDPLVLKCNPNDPKSRVEGLTLLDGLSIDRMNNRRELLKSIDRQQQGATATRQGINFSNQQEQAFSMLTSPKLKKALDVHAEPDNIRDRYGRHLFGQTMLMARRMVEFGMPVIQCNMGRVQLWDTHSDHFPRLKDYLPALDKALSAFLDDLSERGLLDETLVICVGEFGRTPHISPLPGQPIPGRHHWAHAYSAFFAGAGIQGGQVIGKTDAIGAYPVSVPHHPNDIGATVYSALGIDPHQMLTDRLNRPRPLNEGKVMDVLYTGEVT